MLTKEMRKNIVRGILIGALLLFEWFNYSTTRDAAIELFGSTWGLVNLMAFGLASMDIGGIASIFTDSVYSQEEQWVKDLELAWGISAIMNAFFTWFSAAVAIENNMGQVPHILESIIPIYMPVIVAIIILVIRIALVRVVVGMFSEVSVQEVFSNLQGVTRGKPSSYRRGRTV